MVVIKEEEFYNLYCKFMKAGLKTFDKSFVKKILFDEERRKWGIWSMLMKNYKIIEGLNEYIELDVWIKLHPKINNQMNDIVGYGTFSAMLSLYTVLIRSLHTHMLHSGLEPDMSLINGMYVTLEEFFLSPKMNILSITLLRGVKIKEDLEIEKGLVIKNIKKDKELEKFVLNNHSTARQENAIVHNFELPKLVNSNDVLSVDLFYMEYERLPTKVIEAMRLFKSGKFGAFKTITTHPMLHDHKRQIESSKVSEDFWFDEDSYQLKKEEFEDFKKFWIQYITTIKNENSAFLRRAIRRIMEYYAKERWDDKFLDLMIGFEILFKNNEYERSPVIANRLETFLDKNNNSISEKYAIAYKIRNDIVHGGNGESLENIDDKIFSEIDKLMEEYLRKSIQKFIILLGDKSKTKKSIISNIGL